jgi:hypothetical protein
MRFRAHEEASQIQLPGSSPQVVAYFEKTAKEVRDGHASPVSKLKKIYQLSDEITKEISPYEVYERGCSYCCHIDATTTKAWGNN